jgi:hypothetical protein
VPHASSRLERVEECDQLCLLLLRPSHVEALVVEIHELLQIRRCSIVKIGSCGQPAQNGPLDAIQVVALSRDERLARIARVDRDGLSPGLKGFGQPLIR